MLAFTLLVGGITTAGSAIAIPAPTAGAAVTPGSALQSSVAAALSQGVIQYVSVVDRRTGKVVAQTANADDQVGAESVFKLFLAAYYLIGNGGYQSTPASVLSELGYMLRYSDDDDADALYTDDAVPTIAARYGLSNTENSTDRDGHWGATRVTANDLTKFLYAASQDPEVGPWLLPVMAQSAPTGSDGFDQAFGLNALSGVHGSKQGWGCDSDFTDTACPINSVGYTSGYFVAILQLGAGYPDPMRATATATAQAIAASALPSPIPKNGDFIQAAGTSTVYQLVGGTPVLVPDWSPFGGPQPVVEISAAQFAAYPHFPQDGAVVSAGGPNYRIVGGAPVFVS